MNDNARNHISRRTMLAASAAAIGAAALGPRPASAQSGAWRQLEAARTLVGDAQPLGGIALDLPLVSENGSSVPLTVSVERPVDGDDPVTEIHLFAPLNPQPEIAVFRLTPLAGRAEITTRIRLNESQTVIAVARTASGQILLGERDVRVTVNGCLMLDDTYQSANMFQTRLRAPQLLAAGEAGEVLSIINHPMETGLRANAQGDILPKRIIERLEARLDGDTALIAEFNRSVSANPYLRFFVAPRGSATLDLTWTEDSGEAVSASADITVG